MSWVCNLYDFLACTTEMLCYFFCFGQLRVHHWTWAGLVICTTFWLVAVRCCAIIVKTASLKGCQIEKFSPPRTWDTTFNNTQKDYRLAINKTTAAGVTSEVILQLQYVLCTCTAFFPPFVHATTNYKWNSELPNIDPQSLCPRQKWWQTVLEIKSFMQPMRRHSMQSPLFFSFLDREGIFFVFSLFPIC